MDRMLYLSMTGAKQIMLAQTANTHNLANVSTTGFRADLTAFIDLPVNGPTYDSRVYSVSQDNGVDLTPGGLMTTGRELDVAIRGEGYIAVQAPDGTEGYTRAGDFQLSETGQLTTGAGRPVIGSGGPVAIPPFEKLEIGTDGTISIRPVGQEASTLTVVDRIKLVNIPNGEVIKGGDGLLRSTEEASVPADASVQLVSGTLEGSNVNPVTAMVNMIELGRKYEMQVKMMHTAEETERAADALMRVS